MTLKSKNPTWTKKNPKKKLTRTWRGSKNWCMMLEPFGRNMAMPNIIFLCFGLNSASAWNLKGKVVGENGSSACTVCFVNTRLLRNSGIQQWRSKKMRIMLVASIGF